MKKLTIWIVVFLWLPAMSPGYAQGTAEGPSYYHSGNKLRITFNSAGKIEGGNDLTAEWPIATGHEYLKFAMPLVSVEEGGQPEVVSFSPVKNSPGAETGAVAMSHLQETWPESWPDRPASWNGQWNGFFGRGLTNADQESYIVLENSDLGLRLVIRGWQWSHYLAQDMLFLHYALTNTGSKSFDRAVFGFVAQPDVGGDADGDPMVFDRERAQVTAMDPDNVGHGRGVAADVGQWSPVGLFTVRVLETPGVPNDGIDNDGDGLVDESQSDGIDNDQDWLAERDDVGEDGVPDTGDAGEGDGIPTPGEPNFDATDPDEADQIGLTSFAAFAGDGLNLADNGQVWAALTPERFDAAQQTGGEFALGSGYFSLEPGQTRYFSVVLYASFNELDHSLNEEIIQKVYQRSYRFPTAPPRPKVTAVRQNKKVTLYWDNRAESAPDFEGYKIYRSTDPGFNDVYNVTTDRGIPIYSEPVATFDLDNDISRLFPLHFAGFQYFLGKDTGLRHWWTDENVDNGKTYYYAVVAFDHGDKDQGIFPTESPKSIVIQPNGQMVTDINTVIVTPEAESPLFQAPEYQIEHTRGLATGRLEVEIIDRTRIKDNGRYQIVFDDSSFSKTTYSLVDVTRPEQPVTLFENSSNYSTADLRNDADPIFDGLHVFLYDDPLEWDQQGTFWKVGQSNWSIELRLNSNLGTPVPVAADYEVRFGEVGVDTALFSTPIPVPFEVWNVTENKKENILVLDMDGDGTWSSGEPIFIVAGNTLANFKPIFWTITFTAPADPAVTSVPPKAGDVAFIPTRKPFSSKDVYTLTTHGILTRQDVDGSVLDEIAVVPNPYIVNSPMEQRSLYTGGKLIRKLQFIHLPPQCTIRIFTLRGELLKTIEHDAPVDNGSELWDLTTRDHDVVAYGVYVYHVEAPNFGEKIGRFAIIR